MNSKALGFGGVVLIAAMIGCGSSGGGSGGTGTGGTNGAGGGGGTGTFSTSVPSGSKLSSLSSAQATQLCNDINSFGQKTLAPDDCKLTAVLAAAFTAGGTDAQLQAACTSAYNACLAGGDGGVTTTGSCDPTMLTSGSASCTATVGDVTTCANAEVAVFNTIPSCSTLTAASLNALSADGGLSSTAEPTSCMALDACGVTMSSAGSSP
ncbi:MAG TPA: hypothetical protein VH853_01790 [Polyangia bacterium]|jgi:hypothetical protein|nr:hypothetical protein [Polyangia bacterium]